MLFYRQVNSNSINFLEPHVFIIVNTMIILPYYLFFSVNTSFFDF